MENVKIGVSAASYGGDTRFRFITFPDSNDYVVAENITEAVRLVKEKFGQDITAEQLRQDEDCLDTWFILVMAHLCIQRDIRTGQ